jgi:hypothetical protein
VRVVSICRLVRLIFCLAVFEEVICSIDTLVVVTKITLKSFSHSVYNQTYHLVIVTKYRRKIIAKIILFDLQKIFSNICASWRCEADHVHLPGSTHANPELSDLVNNLKMASDILLENF